MRYGKNVVAFSLGSYTCSDDLSPHHPYRLVQQFSRNNTATLASLRGTRTDDEEGDQGTVESRAGNGVLLPEELGAMDRAAVALVLAGHADAFSQLVDRYYPSVVAVSRSVLKDDDAAQEIAQEAFLRAYMGLTELKRPDFFPVWIHRIARNMANDWLRRGRARSRLIRMVPLDETSAAVMEDPKAVPVREQLSEAQEFRRLESAVDDLPEPLREVVRLHFMQAMPKAEIARRLGLDRSSVGRRLDQALERLRHVLSDGFAAPLKTPASADTQRKAANVTAMVLLVAGSATLKSNVAAAVAVEPVCAAASPSIIVKLLSTTKSGVTTLSTTKVIVAVAAATLLCSSGIYAVGSMDRTSATGREPAPTTQTHTTPILTQSSTLRTAPGENARGTDVPADEVPEAMPPQTGTAGSILTDAFAAAPRQFASATVVTAPTASTVFTDDLIIESRREGRNNHFYRETGVWWQDSPTTRSKSSASDLTPFCGSRQVVFSKANDQYVTSVSASAFFEPRLPDSATAFVYVTWPAAANSEPVTAVVRHTGGVTQVPLRQNGRDLLGNANTWVPLGQFRIGADTGHGVELRAEGPRSCTDTSDGVFVADAVRFTATALPDDETTALVDSERAVTEKSVRESLERGDAWRTPPLTVPRTADGKLWRRPEAWRDTYMRLAPRPCALHGQVTDDTSRPLAGASVMVGFPIRSALLPNGMMVQSIEVGRQTTDEQGRFRFNQIQAGVVDLCVSAAGYPTVNLHPLLKPEKALTECSVVLKGNPRIAGTVIGPDGQPVSDVLVSVIALTDSMGRQNIVDYRHNEIPASHCMTDTGGQFLLTVGQNAHYRLMAEPRSSFASCQVSGIAMGDDNVLIRLQRGAAIEGKVVRPSTDGALLPVAGAHVDACSEGDRNMQTTDQAGRFRFEKLSTEVGGITSSTRTWDIRCQDVVVECIPADETTTHIQMIVKDDEPWCPDKWNVMGRVLDAYTSKPVERAQMSVRRPDRTGQCRSGFWLSREVTGGRFNYEELATLGCQLKFDADGYEPCVTPILWPRTCEQVHDVVMKPSSGLMGVITLPGGKRVADAHVTLNETVNQYLPVNGRMKETSVQTTSTADGYFMLPAQHTNEYQLIVLADEGFAVRTGTEVENNPEVVLKPWSRVEGVVRRRAVPAEGVVVQLDWKAAPYIAGTTETKFSRHWQITEQVTGKDGSFVFDRVQPDDAICVQTGQTRTEFFKLRPGETKSLVVEMEDTVDKRRSEQQQHTR